MAGAPRPGHPLAGQIPVLVPARSDDDFRFVENYMGLEVIPKAGSVIAYDGEKPITTSPRTALGGGASNTLPPRPSWASASASASTSC